MVQREDSTDSAGVPENGPRPVRATDPADVLERVTDAFFALDDDWRFTYVNSRAEEVLQVDAADLIGERLWEAFSDAVGTQFEAEYRRAMDEQEPVQFESYFGPLDLRVAVSAYPSESGLSVYFRDVGEQRLHEAVVANIRDGVYATDGEDRFELVNEAFCEMTGYDREELLGEHVSTVHASDSDAVERAREQADDIRAGRRSEGVLLHTIQHKSGEQFPVETRFDSFHRGDEYGRAGVIRDISERRERERELERAERQLEATFNTPVSFMAILNPDGTVRRVNETALSFVDVEASAVEGEPFWETPWWTHAEESQQRLRDNIERAAQGAYVRDEVIHYGADGEMAVIDSVLEPVRDEEGAVVSLLASGRDVTERKAREEELQRRVEQQRAAAEFSRDALRDLGLMDLFETAAETVAETLDVEYAKVLELDADEDRLHLRAGVGWRDGTVGEVSVGTEQDSQAGYTLDSDEPVIVRDLAAETRFSGPELLVDHDVTSGISAVIGSPARPWGVLGAHTTEARTFTPEDADFVQSVANTLMGAIERRRHEEAIRVQGEQLAALNQLNTIAREINHAIVQQSTREEIEQLVCDRLADSSSYAFAWVGAVNPATGVVEPHARAGVEGSLADFTVTVDDSETGAGPVGEAFRTGETQTVHDLSTGGESGPWREAAARYGFESLAVVPIRYNDTIYGALAVYSERADAFTGEELAVLDDIGEIIGHAIQAIERKRLLMSDEVVELDLRVGNMLDTYDVSLGPEDHIVYERTVPLGGDRYVVYGHTNVTREQLDALVAALPFYETVTVLSEADGTRRIAVELDDPPTLGVVADYGGRIRHAELEGSDYRMTVEIPPDQEARSVIDPIREAYPNVETVAQQRVSSTTESRAGAAASGADLTERQQAMLEAAYFEGYFEWPRESSAEEVAERMDVSAPTFHEHLRRAQQKILEDVLEE